MPRRAAPDADGRFDTVAGELYALPPSEFTAARDAHAAQARKDGDRPLAERIRALRRPTLAAWASNLLVRAQPDEVDGVLELGEALRAAHRDLDGARLRALSAQQRTLTTALARQARTLAADAGQALSDQALGEVRDTVQAALADPDSGTAWASGRLTHPLVPPAFPALAPGPPPEPGAGKPKPTKAKPAKAKPAAPQTVSDLDRARARREARAQLAEARRKADAAAARLAELEQAASAAHAQALEAQERRQHARDRQAELRRRIADAKQAERDAAAEERDARHRAEQAERHVTEARRHADEATGHVERLAAKADDPANTSPSDHP
ncbi:hypothetical protein [Yinghuangia seranimata]|uniref:hypothetical protein n=1 Tax=Yinghuangia seranimata TaxID=408067 RepID=UPI00248CFD67|nr:hypothetical protein [Yinghuangia seranimata]MDI2128391.1 hypothetical protein [Yinghuangia seranimata]